MQDIEIALWPSTVFLIHLHCDPVFSYKINHYFFCWKNVSLRIWNRYTRAELCFHVLKCRWILILVIWLNSFYDFDLLRGFFCIANYSNCNSSVRLTWQVDFVDNFGKAAKDILCLWQWKPSNSFHYLERLLKHLPLRIESEVLAKRYSLNPKAMVKIPYAKRCFWDMRDGCFLLLGHCFIAKGQIAGWSWASYAVQLQ